MPPPPVTQELLPWAKLLRSKHFPTGQNSDPEEPSNEDIIKFLETLLGKYKIIKAANDSLTQLVRKNRTSAPKVSLIGKMLINHPSMADFGEIIAKMNSDLEKAVDRTDINAAKLDIEAIASAAEGWKANTNVASAVLEMKSSLIALAPNSAFFFKLVDSEKGEGFPGVEH